VRVRNGSLNNLISGNSIFSNADLGIDLGTYGVNPNVDCESGVAANAANAGQNYPVLTNVYCSTVTHKSAARWTAARARLTAPVFFESIRQRAGYGEGQVFLGQTN
jgi:hypothetical protein